MSQRKPLPSVCRLVDPLLDWFSREARDLPWRHTADPYAIWVSEIMLQQTQVKTVIPYWLRWMRKLPTIEALAAADSATIHKLWEGLGYYTRVRNLQKAARAILERHQGRFPQSFSEVLDLPGIGRYTAGAICSIAFNQPAPILDGNVIRVLTRVFGIDASPREKNTNARLWDLAEQLVRHAHTKTERRRACSELNESLMELGALVCAPRDPKCERCPIAKSCRARRTNRIHQLPNLGPRLRPTARRFAAFVFENNGSFLVRQRPSDVVNAHLWEFPNVELINDHQNPAQAARQVLSFSPRKIEPLGSIKHSITRYRITLDAFAIRDESASTRGTSAAGHWLPLRKLHSLPFTSAHRKILNRLPSPTPKP